MSASVLIQGNVARFTAIVASDTNQIPASVSLLVRDPEGVEQTVSMNLSGAASVYTALVDLTKPGLWRYRIDSTAPAKSSTKGSFNVESNSL